MTRRSFHTSEPQSVTFAPLAVVATVPLGLVLYEARSERHDPVSRSAIPG